MALGTIYGWQLGVKHNVNPPIFQFALPEDIIRNSSLEGAKLKYAGIVRDISDLVGRRQKTFITRPVKLTIQTIDEVGTEHTLLNPNNEGIEAGFTKMNSLSAYRLRFQYEFKGLTLTETMPAPSGDDVNIGEYEFLAFLWSYRHWWSRRPNYLILYPFGDMQCYGVVPVGSFDAKLLDDQYNYVSRIRSSVNLVVSFETSNLYTIIPVQALP